MLKDYVRAKEHYKRLGKFEQKTELQFIMGVAMFTEEPQLQQYYRLVFEKAAVLWVTVPEKNPRQDNEYIIDLKCENELDSGIMPVAPALKMVAPTPTPVPPAPPAVTDRKTKNKFLEQIRALVNQINLLKSKREERETLFRRWTAYCTTL